MNRICLVALIGLPAAGKTSLCQNLLKLKILPFNILHLCYDLYIKINLDNLTQYREQRDKLMKSLEVIVKKLKNSEELTAEIIDLNMPYKNHQHKDFIILCDDNHYYRSMRHKLYQLARMYEVAFCQIHLECNVELAIERNKLRSEQTKVPSEVIVEMSKRLETPNMLTNKWEENTLCVQNINTGTIDNIISNIKEFLDKPVQPLQVPTPKTTAATSVLHDLDLLMRRRINVILTSTQNCNKKFLAETLNEKRKKIIKEFQLHGNSDLNKYVEMLN